MSENEQEQRISGPDVLSAFVYGDDIPALKMAALDKARELYGPDAHLRIERVGQISAMTIRHMIETRGKFAATILVRCLNLPDEDR
jgi:hypothetical protein